MKRDLYCSTNVYWMRIQILRNQFVSNLRLSFLASKVIEFCEYRLHWIFLYIMHTCWDDSFIVAPFAKWNCCYRSVMFRFTCFHLRCLYICIKFMLFRFRQLIITLAYPNETSQSSSWLFTRLILLLSRSPEKKVLERDFALAIVLHKFWVSSAHLLNSAITFEKLKVL